VTARDALFADVGATGTSESPLDVLFGTTRLE
jgi:hypothetical protein